MIPARAPVNRLVADGQQTGRVLTYSLFEKKAGLASNGWYQVLSRLSIIQSRRRASFPRLT